MKDRLDVWFNNCLIGWVFNWLSDRANVSEWLNDGFNDFLDDWLNSLLTKWMMIIEGE